MLSHLGDVLGRLGLDPELESRTRLLSGTGNRSHFVPADGTGIVVRIEGEETHGLVNRRNEHQNLMLAANRGLAPDVVLSDPAAGCLVTGFVSGPTLDRLPRPYTPAVFVRLAAVLEDLKAMSGFQGSMDPWQKIARYLADASIPVPEDDRAVGPAWHGVERLRAAAAPDGDERVCAHVDPVPQNLIDTGDRIVMLDWEYSARSHAMWDPAYFAEEADLSAEEENALFDAFGWERSDRDRFAAWRAVCCLVSLTWCLARRRRSDGHGVDWTPEINARRERFGARLHVALEGR
ncbi:MAG: phosphotransferase [Rhodospirillales bacterium]|nr:phosphotransferase [Rhodospirillales bacterium]